MKIFIDKRTMIVPTAVAEILAMVNGTYAHTLLTKPTLNKMLTAISQNPKVAYWLTETYVYACMRFGKSEVNELLNQYYEVSCEGLATNANLALPAELRGVQHMDEVNVKLAVKEHTYLKGLHLIKCVGV